MKASEEQELLAQASAGARRVGQDLKKELETAPPELRRLLEEVISAAEKVASAANAPPETSQRKRKDA